VSLFVSGVPSDRLMTFAARRSLPEQAGRGVSPEQREDVMRKIKLDVEALEVESFDVAEKGLEKRGTVRGRAFTRDWEQSCYLSCTNVYDCECASEFGPTACPQICP
jgi:hypothetical protein